MSQKYPGGVEIHGQVGTAYANILTVLTPSASPILRQVDRGEEIHGVIQMHLTAGDTVSLQIEQNSGGGEDYTTDDRHWSVLELRRD